MAYNNIGNYISQFSKKLIFTWGFFSILLGAMIGYGKWEFHRISYIKDQINTFSEINNQALSVLYYHDQDKNNSITFEQSLANIWINENQQKISQIIPAITPEINILKNKAEAFFVTNKQENQQVISNYQALSEELQTLKNISMHYTENSYLLHVYQLSIPVILGFFLIILFISLNSSKNLKKEIVSKNNIILEDMWNEIQDFDFEYGHISHNDIQQDSTPTQESMQRQLHELLSQSRAVSQQSSSIKESLVQYMHELKRSENSTISAVPQGAPSLSLEKMGYIQKLLSHLFTRAQRASSLAKSSSDNGFQAGILALNISIEASRAGEVGRKFLPISDRIKDFAEKSSNIGNSILEELKDADLAIRKAYAIGKELLEASPEKSMPASPTSLDLKLHTLNNIIHDFDHIFQLCQSIQNSSDEINNSITLESETNNDSANNSISSRNIEFIKALLVRSFERLYRFNYGIDPPKSE